MVISGHVKCFRDEHNTLKDKTGNSYVDANSSGFWSGVLILLNIAINTKQESEVLHSKCLESHYYAMNLHTQVDAHLDMCRTKM